jgi:hypothetical protein
MIDRPWGGGSLAGHRKDTIVHVTFVGVSVWHLGSLDVCDALSRDV